MRPKIFMTCGLPASGKSTWAKNHLAKTDRPTVRISKDDLRLMLHNGKFTNGNEKATLAARDAIIVASLGMNSDGHRTGRDVIVDDTNLAPKHQARLEQLARENSADFEVVDFRSVPLETCLERDRKRPNSVGDQVILRMWHDYLRPPTPKIEDTGLPRAIVVDLDGTLADLNGRNPYDASTCDQDLIREPVLRAVLNEAEKGTTLVFCSGRQDKDREPTIRFLERCGIWGQVRVPHFLYMRETGDSRPDTEVKREIYQAHIQDRFNVIACYDDRPCIVRLWRSLGLFVFDVGDGVEF